MIRSQNILDEWHHDPRRHQSYSLFDAKASHRPYPIRDIQSVYLHLGLRNFITLLFVMNYCSVTSPRPRQGLWNWSWHLSRFVYQTFFSVLPRTLGIRPSCRSIDKLIWERWSQYIVGRMVKRLMARTYLLKLIHDYGIIVQGNILQRCAIFQETGRNLSWETRTLVN